MVRKIISPPSPGLEALAAIYCIWLANGRRPAVEFGTLSEAVAFGTVVVSGEIDWRTIVYPTLPQEKMKRLVRLVNYCLRAQSLKLKGWETKPGSLKHVISSLRENVTGADYLIWEAFVLLADKILAGSEKLLTGGGDIILSQEAKFRHFLRSTPPPDLNRQGVKLETVAGLRIAFYEGERNITNLVFDQTDADVLIFCKPSLESAGMVVRSKERRPEVDLSDIRRFLPKEENWVIAGEGNVLICGGRRAPRFRTRVTLDDLRQALEGALGPG